jgi:hypothetical protein
MDLAGVSVSLTWAAALLLVGLVVVVMLAGFALAG